MCTIRVDKMHYYCLTYCRWCQRQLIIFRGMQLNIWFIFDKNTSSKISFKIKCDPHVVANAEKSKAIIIVAYYLYLEIGPNYFNY